MRAAAVKRSWTTASKLNMSLLDQKQNLCDDSISNTFQAKALQTLIKKLDLLNVLLDGV